MAGQNKKRLDLLLKEITDPYVQENFYKTQKNRDRRVTYYLPTLILKYREYPE